MTHPLFFKMRLSLGVDAEDAVVVVDDDDSIAARRIQQQQHHKPPAARALNYTDSSLTAAVAKAELDCADWINERKHYAIMLSSTNVSLSLIRHGCNRVVENSDMDAVYWHERLGDRHILINMIGMCITTVIDAITVLIEQAGTSSPSSFYAAALSLSVMQGAFERCHPLTAFMPKLGLHIDVLHMTRSMKYYARDATHRPLAVEHDLICCMCTDPINSSSMVCTIVRGCSDHCEGHGCECKSGIFHLNCLASAFFTRKTRNDNRFRHSMCPLCNAQFCLKDIELNSVINLPPPPLVQEEEEEGMVTPAAPKKAKRRNN